MGGGGKVQIPDWRQYKVEGIKELEQLQSLLAARGLKDPWIRNEVWRYHPDNFQGVGRAAMKSVGRGFKWAFPAVVVTLLAQKFIFKKDEHGGH
ncbi:NADH dehydrogenase [ubiquinone] 1 beta subcomplex subunit 3-like [Haliotis cracherodii]|uniref:NADH dehydrogenase [ubiquinone] 1 beta subcomplex subunit 3-like n=1 Tax=Haliotis cracherodii TaxID=6455 RepID=UPI0039E73222